MADELEPVRQNIEINVIEKGADSAEKDIAKLNTTITASTTATDKQAKENKKVEESFKSLKVQLREAIALQQRLSTQFGATSDEAIAAARAVAGIRDEIGLQQDLVDSYNPDDKFRALTQTASLAALALGGVKEGLAAVGIESEFLDKIIGTAQGLLGVTGAIGGISDAYEVLTASQRAASASAVVAAGTTEALAVAETQATATTWSWNAALLANPIVAIAAAIVAAGAALFVYIKYTNDAAKATALSVMKNDSLVRSLEGLEYALNRSNQELDFQTNKQLAMAKAQGLSSSAIRELTFTLAQQETAEKKLNSAKADALVLEAERALRTSEADDETKKSLKETLDAAIKFSQEQSKILSDSYQKQRQIIANNEVEIVQERTDRRNKAIEEAKRLAEQERAEEQKLLKERGEAGREAYEQEIKDYEDFKSKSIDAKIQGDIDEAERVAENLAAITAAQDEELLRNAEKQAQIDQYILEQKKEVEDRKIAIAESSINLIKTIFGKSKGIQKAALIAESAVGIAKTVQNTFTGNAAALAQGIAQAGPVAGPALAAPAIVLNSVQGGLSVAGNIAATAKGLSALGGGGAPSASGATQAAPTRNVAQVGFQGSSENQISTAVAKQQKEQPPIQAFVVSQSITDQQEIDRKKELQNSF